MSNKSTNSQTIVAEDVQIDGDMNLSVILQSMGK